RPAPPESPIAAQPQIHPGGDKATLILADGTEYLLSNQAAGTLREDGSLRITQGKGEIRYNWTGVPAGSEHWNTILTPLGGRYQVRLPDGSRVWLNAGSRLRFPSAFPGK